MIGVGLQLLQLGIQVIEHKYPIEVEYFVEAYLCRQVPIQLREVLGSDILAHHLEQLVVSEMLLRLALPYLVVESLPDLIRRYHSCLIQKLV